MNISLSFNTIISTCLNDISTSLKECALQIHLTSQNIEQTEKLLKDNKASAEKLQLLIISNKKLLLDNFCLISKQSQLITHYHQLISIISRKNLIRSIEKEQNILNDLLGYYEKHDKGYNTSLIQQYLQKIS